MDHTGSLDTWLEFVTVPWTSEEAASGRYVEVIVNFRDYLHQLVLGGGSEVAARAARVLLDHPPLAATSRSALAIRFPQTEEI